MKRLTIAGWMLLAIPTLAFAGNGWGLFAAYWNADDGDDVFGAGLGCEIEITEGVDLQLRGTYFDDLIDGSAAGGADLQVIPLEAGLSLKTPVGDDLTASAGGGLGYYLMDAESGAGGAANPDDEIGFYLSAGLELVIRSSGATFGDRQTVLFAEAVYRSVSADDVVLTSTGAEDADLDGLGFNIGLKIAW